MLAFGSFHLHPDDRVESVDGRPLSLPPRAVTLLRCLASGPGEILSKDQLLTAAWPDSFVSEDSLTHAISLVRQALGDDPQSPRYIQTVPRRGYRFVAEVTVLDSSGETTSAAAAPTTAKPLVPAAGVDEAPASSRAPRRDRSRRGAAAAAAAGVIGIVLVGLWMGADRAPAPPPLHIDRLAVTVFAAPRDEPDLHAFAAALPVVLADLIERETKLGVLRPGGPAAADDEALLTGELRRQGDAVAVIARVRGAGTPDNWWRQEWLLPADDLDTVAFARSLVSRVRFLLDLASPYSTLRRSPSAEASLLVVQASELLLGPAQRDMYVGLQAAEALARAVQLDPGFARARAGRVAALAETAGWRPLTPTELAEAQAEAERALADDPEDPIVHVALALAALLREDLGACQEALERARELAPDLFWVYLILADVELRAGLPDVALATVRRGLDLDPYLHALHGRLVDVQLAAGDLDGAAATIDRLSRFDPDGYWSGRAAARLHVHRGELGRAEEELLRLRARWADAPWVHLELADFYRRTGREADAVEVEAALTAFAR